MLKTRGCLDGFWTISSMTLRHRAPGLRGVLVLMAFRLGPDATNTDSASTTSNPVKNSPSGHLGLHGVLVMGDTRSGLGVTILDGVRTGEGLVKSDLSGLLGLSGELAPRVFKLGQGATSKVIV